MGSAIKSQKYYIGVLASICVVGALPCFYVGIYSAGYVLKCLACVIVMTMVSYYAGYEFTGKKEAGLLLAGLMTTSPSAAADLYLTGNFTYAVCRICFLLFIAGLLLISEKKRIPGFGLVLVSALSLLAVLYLTRVQSVADFRGMGLSLAQYFEGFSFAATEINYYENGMRGALACGPGLGCMLAAIVVIGYPKCSFRISRKIKLLAAFILISVFFSLRLFPWDFFQARADMFGALLCMLKSPRFFTIPAGILIALLATLIFECNDACGDARTIQKATALLYAAIGIQSVIYIFSISRFVEAQCAIVGKVWIGGSRYWFLPSAILLAGAIAVGLYSHIKKREYLLVAGLLFLLAWSTWSYHIGYGLMHGI